MFSVLCGLLASTEALVPDAVRHVSVSLSGADWTLSSPPRVAGVPALVPNDIADDLERAGLLPDLWYGLNSMNRSKWLWEREWTLTREFSTPHANATSWLAFDGVDYNCTVALNGQILGSHVGAFERFELDVSSVLVSPLSGRNNTLELTLHPPPQFILDDLYPNQSTTVPGYPVSNEGLDHCRVNREMLPWRSRLNFWDFATKHWSSGIWKHVALRQTTAAARLAPEVRLRAELVAPYASASLIATVRWRTLDAAPRGSSFKLKLSATCAADPSGASAVTAMALDGASFSLDGGDGWRTVTIDLTVHQPLLWWPNGYGAQHLYSVNITLLQCDQAAHAPADATSCVVADSIVEPTFGFRELSVLENELTSPSAADSWLYAQWGYPDPKGKPWILNSSDYPSPSKEPLYPDKRKWLLAVNGRRIFARGGNWLPLDQMFGRGVREIGRMRAVLTLARDAGYTFFRVWGGGLIEDQSFYRLCDELGVLIEQEMPAAGCMYTPPDWADDVQLDSWKAQLPMVLSQLVNHPSVARYSMANEFYNNFTFS